MGWRCMRSRMIATSVLKFSIQIRKNGTRLQPYTGSLLLSMLNLIVPAYPKLQKLYISSLCEVDVIFFENDVLEVDVHANQVNSRKPNPKAMLN